MDNFKLGLNFELNPELEVQLQATNDDDYEKAYLAMENFLSARSKPGSVTRPERNLIIEGFHEIENKTLSPKIRSTSEPIYNPIESLKSKEVNIAEPILSLEPTPKANDTRVKFDN